MAAAVAGSMVVLGGCGSGESSSPGGAGAPTVAGGAVAGVAEDCKAAIAPFQALVASMLRNAVPSEGTSPDDLTAKTREALGAYAASARQQAAKVSDPALRTALEHQAAAAEELSKAADPTAIDNAAFTSASSEIEKACASGLTVTASPGTPTTRLGAAGSACTLPVTFDLLPLWKPKAIDLSGAGELASLYRNGPFEAVCEVDAKPAGQIGFLRVFVAPGRTGSPRSHLEAFIAGQSPEARKAGNFQVKKTDYRDVTVGGNAAAEVTYETYNKAMDQAGKYSAFAVNTPKGAVVVSLTPFGADEHADVLPAFELAKRTLTVSG